MFIRTMMILGEFRFEVSTAAYQSLRRTQTFRWPAQQRLGRTPALQYTGPEAGSIELSGTIYPLVWGGLRQVQEMAAMAGRGEPLELISGLGEVLGRWCILDVSETGTIFTGNGQPQRIEFSLKLQFYGEDEEDPAGDGPASGQEG